MLEFLYNLTLFPLIQVIEFSFVFSQKIFKETYISLLFISLIISILCLPLYNIAEKWQKIERNIQGKMKSKLEKIRHSFSGDERYMITSAYYRQNNYHPVYAMRSSFGLFIQIPFFIAAYIFISNLEAVKGAHFIFIRDLGLPDGLLQIGELKINLLPIIMTGINLVSGAVYTKGFQFTEKLQIPVMAVFFLIILYNSPSALVIYWTVNNLFSLFKNLYFSVKNPNKKYFLFLLLSVSCLLLIYYIIFFHKGDSRQRIIISFSAAVLCLLPWIYYIIKKAKISFKIYYSNNNLNIYVYLLSLTAICITTGLFIPSMLIVSSPEEFSYIDTYSTPLYFIYCTLIQSLGFFLFWPLLIYFLFSNKIKNIFCLLAMILCFSSLLNTFIFSGNYGLVSIDMRLSNGVGHSMHDTIFNILLLITVLIISFILHYFRKHKFIIPFLSFCLFALLFISVKNISDINRNFSGISSLYKEKQNETISLDPIFSLSKYGSNTIIIMLDRASSSFFSYILEESPELKNSFSGFIYYPNTVSFNGYTLLGAPPVFGGYEYIPEEINKRDSISLLEKHNESLLLLPKIFSEAGFSVTVTDPPYPNYSKNPDFSIYENFPNVSVYLTDGVYTNLWLEENNLMLPSASAILKRNIFWYGLFRVSPLIIRRGLYQYGDWCSSIPGQNIRTFLNGYSFLDYLPELGKITESNDNTFLMIVNNTSHDGALLQEPDYVPVLNISNYYPGPYNKHSEYHINMAAYKRLSKWFSFLKKNNVYDNTRIIIVSDHGSQINYVIKPYPSMPQNIDNYHPILLVKDFNSHGELIFDMTFMTNADVPFIALQDQIENPINPFTGNKIDTNNKNNKLYIAVSGSVHLEDPAQTRFTLDPSQDFFVSGGFFEEYNWSKVIK